MKILIVITCALLLWLPASALARQNCLDHDAMVKDLVDVKKQVKVLQAVTYSGYLLEIFASSVGHWTELLTSPMGCSMKSGLGRDLELTPALDKGT